MNISYHETNINQKHHDEIFINNFTKACLQIKMFDNSLILYTFPFKYIGTNTIHIVDDDDINLNDSFIYQYKLNLQVNI